MFKAALLPVEAVKVLSRHNRRTIYASVRGSHDVVDTLIKRDSSAILLLHDAGLKLLTPWVKRRGLFGPMPVGKFLQEFLPTSQIPDDDPSAFAAGAFSFVICVRNEESAYTPFISAIKPFPP